MATMREIKRRIRAIDNTRQITRAMHMVAAAKLRKAKEQAQAGAAYADRLRGVLARLTASGAELDHPLLDVRENERTMRIVIASDRGLCGSYNANLLKHALREIEALELDQLLYAIGRYASDQLARRGIDVARSWADIGEEADLSLAREVAGLAMEAFLSGLVDRVEVIFTRFESAISFRPTTITVLPFSAGLEEQGAGDSDSGSGLKAEVDYIIEPSPEEIFEELLPMSVQIQIYSAMLEAKAAEHAARMTAMKNATDNAEELIDDLTLAFNRARQAEITQEIAEIVSGAETLDA